MHRGRRKRIRGKWKHRAQLLIIGALVAGIFSTSAFLLWAASIEIPDFSLFEARKISQSTKIFDRTGKVLLYDVHKDIRRTVVPFDQISSHIKNASVAIEDEHFYQHAGIEPKAIIRAVLVNLGLREGYTGQGGSTITQQVIKNALLSREKTVTRKIKEWILAMKLERIIGKEEILALYLNESPYGGNIYGIEEASMIFFGHRANDLSLLEAAYLAALPQSPTRYSPYGNHLDELEERKNLVLKKMLELGSISSEEYDLALSEKVKFLPPQEYGIRAPHFVMFVREFLVEQYGEAMIEEGGLKVITTLDMDLQEKAEETVKEYAEQNEKQFNATNAALVALDPKTGDILAMVGSRNYFDIAHEGNFNVALAKRQPGSAFKPFVYASAFEAGYTPDTVVFDVSTQFSTYCDSLGKPLFGADPSFCYMPENYDGAHRGPITLRNALAQSINIPSVKLLYLVGLDHAIEFAERVGITTLQNKERYGLTLVLGGGEVSLLEMTSAYGVFANDGRREPYHGILAVENAAGSVIFESAKKEMVTIDPEVARKISDVLSDNEARAPAFGEQSYLRFDNHQVAVKTGTTNDYRDAWIIGYTPSLAVGAWAGNNNNTPMEKKVAGFIVAPLWNAYMTKILPSFPDERFPAAQPTPKNIKPSLRGIWYGGDVYTVDKVSGKRATEFTPSELVEERVVPNPHEILYWVNKAEPGGPPPLNPYDDPQFLLWETPAQEWIQKNGLPAKAWGRIPDTIDDVHRPELAPKIAIIEPNATTTYLRTQKLVVDAQVQSSFSVERVDFFVNGVFLGSTRSMPHSFAFVPNDVQNIQRDNELRLAAYDIVGNRTEQTMFFTVEL
ncbi:MAG: PBP1A family penicillin-binding protein [bacterium]|nr:PBP1A family penicillin-binding protein [bacterium]